MTSTRIRFPPNLRNFGCDETVEEYIIYLENVANLMDWTPVDIGAVLLMQLPHSMRRVRITLENCDSTNIAHFKKALREEKQSHRDANVLVLLNLKKEKGETIKVFAEKIAELVESCYPKVAMTTRKLLSRDFFVNGVGHELRKHVMPRKFSSMSFEECIILMESMEESLKTIEKKPKHGNKYCSLHKTSSHDDAHCHSQKKKDGTNVQHVRQQRFQPKIKPSTSRNQTINTISANRFFLPIMCEGKKLNALIDTGARRSFIPMDGSKSNVKCKTKFFSADMSPIKTDGIACVEISFDQVTMPFQLVRANVNQVILGQDFITCVKGTISYDGKFGYQVDKVHKRVQLIKEDDFIDLTSDEMIELICRIDESVDKTKFQAQLNELLGKYHQITNKTGRTDLIHHSIELKDNSKAPPRLKTYRIPIAYEDEIQIMIDQWISDGTIEYSKSEWCSPLVVVKKKDGSLRLAIDFRILNERCKYDAYPSPRIDELLQGLHNASIFSKLDFKSAYHQIPLDENSKEFTAFRFRNQLYQFAVMPFGLATASQTCIRLMNRLFGNIPFVKVYIDDVLIFSKSHDEHIKHIEEIFSIISDANLTINLRKCEFFKEKVEYLGFTIRHNSIQPSDEKVAAIRKLEFPENKKQLKHFLGLTSYYRNLIPKFAHQTSELYGMLKKNAKFVRSEEAIKSFSMMKNLLTSEPCVKIPDFSKPFIVRTDASKKAMGAVLLQEDDNNTRHVIEYFSKAFNDCQQRYATIEQEATSIISALERWRYYLLGRKFTLETDHRPLVWLKSMTNTNSKLQRIWLKLQDYRFDIIHVPGKENIDADFLSRANTINAISDNITELQQGDEKLQEAICRQPKKFQSIGNIYYKIDKSKELLCVPQSMVKELLIKAHKEDGAHCGMQKTLDRIRQRFFWPHMRTDTCNFVKKCPQCRKAKPSRMIVTPLNPINSDDKNVWEHVAVDIDGPYPLTARGARYVINIVDYKSKFLISNAVSNIRTTTIITKLQDSFNTMGYPKRMTTDRAAQFESQEFKRFMDSKAILHHLTTAYHHQSNGMVERVHRTIQELIRCDESNHDWDVKLTNVVNAYNTSIHTAIKTSPYEAFFGRAPITGLDKAYPTRTQVRNPKSTESYRAQMKKQHDKRLTNLPLIKENDTVWIKRLTTSSRALDPRHHGPYKVTRMIPVDKIQIEGSNGKRKVVHRNMVIKADTNDSLVPVRGRGRPARGGVMSKSGGHAHRA